MNDLLRTLCRSTFVALCAAQTLQAANLVTDGTFTGVTLTSTGKSQTNLYGQFGTDSSTAPKTPAQGSQITVGGWNTGGYNFVFLPGTLDGGGTGSTVPAETGGTTGVYMWGTNNAGNSVVPTNFPGAPDANGNLPNCIASDGAYETGAITQQINGLVLGAIYQVNFSWAAGQQSSFNGNTTETWQVQLGTSAALTTPAYALGTHNFSGWMTGVTSTGDNFNFTANATSETLSFLAVGTPTGEPPFSLLSNVSLNAVPEPTGWAWSMGGGVALTALAVVRRRRARRLAA